MDCHLVGLTPIKTFWPRLLELAGKQVAQVPQDLRSLQSVKLVNGCPFPPPPSSPPPWEPIRCNSAMQVVVIKNAQVVKSRKSAGKTVVQSQRKNFAWVRIESSSLWEWVCMGRDAPEVQKLIFICFADWPTTSGLLAAFNHGKVR